MDVEHFVCPTAGCPRTYLSRSNLRRHMREKHTLTLEADAPVEVVVAPRPQRRAGATEGFPGTVLIYQPYRPTPVHARGAAVRRREPERAPRRDGPVTFAMDATEDDADWAWELVDRSRGVRAERYERPRYAAEPPFEPFEGPTSPRVPEDASEEESGATERAVCCACMDKRASAACRPCYHMCLCLGCARDWMRRSATCPICQRHVEEVVRIFQ